MSEDDRSRARLFKLLCLLWLAGITLRVTILAVPPVIPLIHDELHLSPKRRSASWWACRCNVRARRGAGLAAGARLGALRTLVIGMVITALAGSGRGGAIQRLDALSPRRLVMGFGVAIMQPALAGAGARMGAAAHGARQPPWPPTGCWWAATLASVFTAFRLVLPLVGEAGGSTSSSGRRRCC